MNVFVEGFVVAEAATAPTSCLKMGNECVPEAFPPALPTKNTMTKKKTEW